MRAGKTMKSNESKEKTEIAINTVIGVIEMALKHLSIKVIHARG